MISSHSYSHLATREDEAKHAEIKGLNPESPKVAKKQHYVPWLFTGIYLWLKHSSPSELQSLAPNPSIHTKQVLNFRESGH